MTKSLIALAMTASILAPMVQAASPCDGLQAALKQTMPGTKIDAVRESEIPGLCETVMGRNIAYVSPAMPGLLMIGHIFDLSAQRDFTQEKLDALRDKTSTLKWNELPLKGAVVTGTKGAPRVAVFTDPDCPYCRKLEQSLATMDGIEIHHLLLPLDGLHPESREKSVSILCAKDQAKALKEAMVDGKPLPSMDGKAACRIGADGHMKAVSDFASANGIHGTPYLVREDGKVLQGFREQGLKEWTLAGKPQPDTASTKKEGKK